MATPAQIAARSKWASAFRSKMTLDTAKKECARRKRNERAKELYDEFSKLYFRNRYRKAHGIPVEAPLLKANRQPL